MTLDLKTMAIIGVLLQVALLATVLVSVYQARIKRKLLNHCKVIRVTLTIQLLVVLFRMLPLMLTDLKTTSQAFRTEILVHHSLGLLLILLWVYINLAVMGRVKVFGRLNLYMWAALLVWVSVFALGIHQFFQLYIPA